MSATTLDRLQVSYFRTAIDGYTVDKRQDGSGVLRAIPVFRAGTFRDSMGEQHTWEREHLERMIFHFDMLREREILPNVPVRDQHRSLFGGGGTVVGYVEQLYVEGEDSQGNPLLVADLDITEPDAFGKIERGTWRSRSAEIGYYETNDEAMYWPVFMGVAWVDLPAVEGLFSKSQKKPDNTFTPIHDEEGGPVGNAKNHNQGGTEPAEQEQEPGTEGGTGAENGGGSEPTGEGNPNPAAPGTPAGEGGTEEQPPQGQGQEQEQPAQPGTTEHSKGGGTFEFSINGQPTTDFAAVQQHITNLETVIEEGSKQARKDFVNGLASKNVIPATQVESMTNHALGLNDKQYEEFTKMYEGAPAVPLFQHHGQGDDSEPSEASEIEVLRERVAMHRRSGISQEKVEQTESYKKLMKLTDNKG